MPTFSAATPAAGWKLRVTAVVAVPVVGLTASQLGTVVRSTWKNKPVGLEEMAVVCASAL